MLLRAGADITDKEGNRLGLNGGIYVHHIGLIDTARSMTIAPLDEAGSTCPGAKDPLASLFGSAANMPGPTSMSMAGHSHSKRQTGPFAKLRPPFSPLFVKGNEADAIIYAPGNSTSVKSGYWIGAHDPIVAIAEVINYQAEQDVYFTVDFDYLPFENSNGARPKDYLEVAMGSVRAEKCGHENVYQLCKLRASVVLPANINSPSQGQNGYLQVSREYC
jgi:hypothetical protein